MKILGGLLILVFVSTNVSAQQQYWQQQVRYNIKATLNDDEKSITASETIIYKNNSDSALDFIVAVAGAKGFSWVYGVTWVNGPFFKTSFLYRRE